MRVRIARDELRRIRELTQTIKPLEAEIARRVAQLASQPLSEPGFGPLTAAKLIGEIAGADRFSTDGKLARAAGVATVRGQPCTSAIGVRRPAETGIGARSITPNCALCR
jgi:transposase